MSTEIRTRFAPSPTGFLHIGGVRTALYNYLFARKMGGEFILRIEDTDLERSDVKFTNVILDGMKWLGLNWDEGPYFQSKRQDLYKKAIEKLIDNGNVYKCFCSADELKVKREEANKKGQPPGYDGKCKNLTQKHIEIFKKENRKYVYRLKVPANENIKFSDIIKGDICVNSDIIKDFIVVKSSGIPTYNFACVVDDSNLKITHIIRGDDHISNTAHQILIYKMLKEELPKFAHLPQVHSADGKRLSKRTGAVSVDEYRKDGYLPEAIKNYLALLGWSTEDSQQIFQSEELIEKFELSRCGKSAGIFDMEKLYWMNGVYIRKLSAGEVARRAFHWLKESELLQDNNIPTNVISAIKLEQDKIKLLSDIPDLIDFMVKNSIKYDEKSVKKRLKKEGVQEILTDIVERIQNLNNFTAENIENLFRDYCEEKEIGVGRLFHPVRVAVSGIMKGPGLFELLEFIGKERTVKRMMCAIKTFVEEER